MTSGGEKYARSMQGLWGDFKIKNLRKIQTFKLDKRIVAYRSCVMTVNKLSYVTTQVVRFTVQGSGLAVFRPSYFMR